MSKHVQSKEAALSKEFITQQLRDLSGKTLTVVAANEKIVNKFETILLKIKLMVINNKELTDEVYNCEATLKGVREHIVNLKELLDSPITDTIDYMKQVKEHSNVTLLKISYFINKVKEVIDQVKFDVTSIEGEENDKTTNLQ